MVRGLIKFSLILGLLSPPAHGQEAAPDADGEYDEVEEPVEEPVEEEFDEPPVEEPPPPEEPEEVVEPEEPMEPDDPPEEREPPPAADDVGGPRPDPNYGRDTGTAVEVVDPDKEEKRKVIRTVPRKEYTPAERRAYCDQYEGRLVSFYSEIFRVEKCKRRKIVNNKTVYTLMRDGEKIVTVSQDIIAALPEGSPLDQAIDKQSARSCQQLEGSYVSYSNVEVYFVQDCKKRVFPDWETYMSHRKKRGVSHGGEIKSLSWIEFSSMRDGEPIASIIDGEYQKLLDGSAGVDILPLDEACNGVDGRIATYYAKLYKIENCRKREIADPSEFFKKRGGESKYIELTSQQWLSLPNGKPINNERDLSPPSSGH